MPEKEKVKSRLEKPALSYWDRLNIGEEKDQMIENLSILLAAGMPVVAALESIEKETKSPALRKMLKNIIEEVADGSALWRSLDKAEIFPKHFIALIRIGEQSGRLSENLKIVAASQTKDRVFRSKIKSALSYPIFVFFLIFFIGLGVTWFILPRLSRVFLEMKITLPWMTKIIMSFGEFLRTSGIIFVPSVIVLVLALIYFIFFFPKTKFVGQAIIFAIPITRKIVQEIELSRAGYVLGSLLGAGMPIVQSLDALADSSTIMYYERFYKYLSKSISQGNTFARSFSEYQSSRKLFPGSIQQMINSSELSGSLSDTLIHVGEIYETKTDISAKNLATMLEPIFLIIVWFGVLFIALAVILPIYGLIGGISNSIN